MKTDARYFWRTPTWQALLEGWLLGLVMLILILPAMDNIHVISLVMPLTMAAAAGWAALRARLLTGQVGPLLVREFIFSTISSAIFIVLVVAVANTYPSLGMFDRTLASRADSYVFLVLGLPGCFGVRLASYVWRRWDNLRRTHYLWGLTHSILCLIAGVAAVAFLIAILVTSRIFEFNFSGLSLNAILARSVIWTFYFLLATFVGVSAGVAFFLLPVSLFSYSVARRLTDRLESLMKAASALRGGNLTARVDVQGKDELAVLQGNFNSMADHLEASTRALQEERDKVANLLRAQRELTASVSHELRTPVATLSGYVESLRRDLTQQTPESLSHDLEIIAHEAVRLQTILDDLLTLSQTEVNRLSLHMGPQHLEEIIQQAVDTLAPLAWRSKRVQVLAELAAHLPPAWADGLRLEQILINLIQNGVRHTPPGGIVSVGASCADGRLALEVADTGEGIPVEELERIWEKFYQAGEAGSQGEGSGLGLPLVKELAEAMGGRVEVRSVPGEGSVFRVFLTVLDGERPV